MHSEEVSLLEQPSAYVPLHRKARFHMLLKTKFNGKLVVHVRSFGKTSTILDNRSVFCNFIRNAAPIFNLLRMDLVYPPVASSSFMMYSTTVSSWWAPQECHLSSRDTIDSDVRDPTMVFTTAPQSSKDERLDLHSSNDYHINLNNVDFSSSRIPKPFWITFNAARDKLVF